MDIGDKGFSISSEGVSEVSSQTRSPSSSPGVSSSASIQDARGSEQGDMDVTHTSFPVFKGLQRPLEFLIFQGRYIWWAAITAVVAIIGFLIVYIFCGFLIGLVVAVVSLSVGSGMILLKQRKGLHSKKIDHGVFIYSYSKRL